MPAVVVELVVALALGVEVVAVVVELVVALALGVEVVAVVVELVELVELLEDEPPQAPRLRPSASHANPAPRSI